MEDIFQTAERRLLVAYGMSINDLDRVLSKLMSKSVVLGDVYLQHSRNCSMTFEDGVLKNASNRINQGVGVRAITDTGVGFAHSSDIAINELLETAATARSFARDGHGRSDKSLVKQSYRAVYPSPEQVCEFDYAERIDTLRNLDELMRSMDPAVKRVIIEINANLDTVMIATSDGDLTADVRPMTRINFQVIAERNGKRGIGLSGGAGRCGYSELIDSGSVYAWARDAVRQALVTIEAVTAPAGRMDVVLGPGWPGIMLHEAVGHCLEGDSCRKGISVFSGRMGQKVAADNVTVVDDGTLQGRHGSLTVDDEGTPSQCTTLIENGRLVSCMQDKYNARLSGLPSTGNGRRQSFAHRPIPRMTNTYMRPGEHDPDEIIGSVERGIYAVRFNNGQADVTNGQFTFSANEAYLIENGKITKPIRGVVLTGKGPEVLMNISMVGNDLRLDDGGAICTKDGQYVPVCVGMPTIKVTEMTIGGR